MSGQEVLTCLHAWKEQHIDAFQPKIVHNCLVFIIALVATLVLITLVHCLHNGLMADNASFALLCTLLVTGLLSLVSNDTNTDMGGLRIKKIPWYISNLWDTCWTALLPETCHSRMQHLMRHGVCHLLSQVKP